MAVEQPDATELLEATASPDATELLEALAEPDATEDSSATAPPEAVGEEEPHDPPPRVESPVLRLSWLPPRLVRALPLPPPSDVSPEPAETPVLTAGSASAPPMPLPSADEPAGS